jgi:hypothetical protein
MLRDALVVAAVAVLTVQGLRRWYGDRYLVPSDSMEPILFGHPENGDVVFVDKTVSKDSVGRGDMVVIADPRRPGHQLVKRIAASGDEKGKTWLNIINGDIFLGDSRQQMVREVKEPAAAMARSVTWGLAGGSAEARNVLDLLAARGAGQQPASASETGPWLLPPVESSLANVRSAFRIRAHDARHKNIDDGVLPPGVIGTNRPVDATFVDLEGHRDDAGSSTAVIDCGMEVQFENRPDVVLGSIDNTDFTTTFVWLAASNTVAIWLDGESVHNATNVLAEEWRGKLTFGRLDGRDFIMLDDVYTLPIVIPGKATSPLPRTWVHLAVVGEVTAQISSLRVFRDVFATRIHHEISVGEPRWPILVEPGHWFLLGDNAFDSKDSRQIGAQPASSFMGVPTYVIGPWARARRLQP